ncbi:uncharacterized protein EKO05_0003231 [Ascochyta rabiei]|uniref:uncharacterized protein n=1 Tax=Didymella rabiei TaxID=5454 RepID=UPI0019019845|nr:uncharacterized protein EKO05_0003231 [Ascochyta rabiei]UPX12692.1 hypothetical protein EKO05_0003231 [Ascochyta rabiei]
MTHASTEQLGTDFANGWRKLPNGLKAEVLKHNLVFGKRITHRRSNGYLHDPTTVEKAGEFDHGAILRHRIALGPEIAVLALQVFYEENTTEISCNRFPIYVPPQNVRHYIVKLTWPKLDAQHSWPLSSKLATSASHFNKLRHLTLVFAVLVKQCDIDFWRDYAKYDMPKLLSCSSARVLLRSSRWEMNSHTFILFQTRWNSVFRRRS